jgi:membrane protein implicated in regulation of membrane protease activity
MEFQVMAWHWLVLAMGLMAAELFFASFTIFWFGLGAFVPAALLWLFPGMGFSTQLFIWAVASCGFTLLWFKLFKQMVPDRTKAGIAREAAIGESGQVIRPPHTDGRGQVRFTTPLLGSDEWPFICDQETMVGDRVFVKEISGNTLIVEKR